MKYIIDEFWDDILVKDGKIDIEQLKKELSDFYYIIQNVPEVYCEITGNRISKPYTEAAVVLDYYREYLNESIKEAFNDFIENYLEWDEEVDNSEIVMEMKRYAGLE
jgi:hypothetical protein